MKKGVNNFLIMYNEVIKGVNPGAVTTVTIDNRKYEIKIEEYSNVGGYAPTIIKDVLTGDYFFSDGYLELNNHVFITKWEKRYEPSRDNWISSDDLLIQIL